MKCPKCGGEFCGHPDYCPHCNQKFKWVKKEKSEARKEETSIDSKLASTNKVILPPMQEGLANEVKKSETKVVEEPTKEEEKEKATNDEIYNKYSKHFKKYYLFRFLTFLGAFLTVIFFFVIPIYHFDSIRSYSVLAFLLGLDTSGVEPPMMNVVIVIIGLFASIPSVVFMIIFFVRLLSKNKGRSYGLKIISKIRLGKRGYRRAKLVWPIISSAIGSSIITYILYGSFFTLLGAGRYQPTHQQFILNIFGVIFATLFINFLFIILPFNRHQMNVIVAKVKSEL